MQNPNLTGKEYGKLKGTGIFTKYKKKKKNGQEGEIKASPDFFILISPILFMFRLTIV